MIYNQ